MRPSFLHLFLCCITCAAGRCQSTDDINRIEFTSLTRGYQKQIFISRDSVIQLTEGRQDNNKNSKRKIGEGEWERLTDLLKDVEINQIPELKSPTSRRAFDGAKHSTISVFIGDGNVFRHSFDDENPHPKLKPLMDAITKIEGEDN